MEALWSSEVTGMDLLENDIEVKKEARANAVQVSDDIIADIKTRVLSWLK